MNKYCLIAGLVLPALLISSCEDKLNKTNPNSLTVESYFTTSEQLKKAVNGAYTTLNGSFLVGSAYIWLHDLRSDELAGTTLADERGDILRGVAGVTNSYIEHVWRGFYIVIHRCNVVINNKVADDLDGVNNTLKSRVVAEAKFLRGLSYFELATLWGAVPLITKPVTSFDGFVARSPQLDIFKAAIQDLKEAADVLPPSYGAADNGRATSGAANAMLGRVYMQMRDYANAKTYLEKVRGSNKYSLVDDSNWNFDEEHEFNNESIFEVVFVPLPNAAEDEGDDYKEGQYRESTNGTRQYDVHTGNGIVVPPPTLINEYEPNDPRYKAAIYVPGDTWAGGTQTESDGTSWKKYTLSYKNATPGAVASGINRRMIRYAEVLLMLAECENETGSQTNAIARLNEVRSRADVAAKLGKYPTTRYPCNSKDEVTKAIIHEKRVEFPIEQIRNRDILRWRVEKKLALVGGDPITYFKAERHELLPIPQLEIDRNTALGNNGVKAQNPGY